MGRGDAKPLRTYNGKAGIGRNIRLLANKTQALVGYNIGYTTCSVFHSVSHPGFPPSPYLLTDDCPPSEPIKCE